MALEQSYKAPTVRISNETMTSGLKMTARLQKILSRPYEWKHPGFAIAIKCWSSSSTSSIIASDEKLLPIFFLANYAIFIKKGAKPCAYFLGYTVFSTLGYQGSTYCMKQTSCPIAFRKYAVPVFFQICKYHPIVTYKHYKFPYENHISPLIIYNQIGFVSWDLHPRNITMLGSNKCWCCRTLFPFQIYCIGVLLVTCSICKLVMKSLVWIL